MNYTDIRKLISANRLAEAAALLPSPSEAKDAEALYLLGRIAWKEGRKTDAISLYNAALALDPESEAAVALEQASGIMDFYHRDLYNP
ncbi:MAG: tetratricopeptide repeat protein [Bacteroidales bacterium]|nr:tetratricopeptide repeat protein [Bacteroidales bacterium]